MWAQFLAHKTHGQSEPHLSAIETWKAVATGSYWWPTWGNDVCNHLKYCKTCTRMETREKRPGESQNSSSPKPTPELDWRHPITQQLKSFEELNHVGTHENLGLLSLNTEAYFITRDGFKHRLPNEKIKMCVTKNDAMDWVKRVHEYQIPHLIRKTSFTQIYKGPYWWPTIFWDVTHLIDECKPCQITTISDLKIENYEAILFLN